MRIGIGLAQLATAIVMGIGSPASAHHSFAAHYFLDQSVELEGTVSEFAWRNPHCFLYVDVLNDDGERVSWVLELQNTILATNIGWTADTFKPGDEIAFAGNPARTGTMRLRATLINRPADGFSFDVNANRPGPGETIGTFGL